MIKKIIHIIIISYILLFILSCGQNSNNVTSPITKNDGGYTVKGLNSKYNAVWKFFNADATGNKAVDIVIDNGAISGLIVSNKMTKIDFDRESIYSHKNEKENVYYGRYFGYIVSDKDWVGEIQFPIYEDETVGYVYIRGKNSSDLIVGMLDKSPGFKDGIDKAYFGKRSRVDNGLKRTVDIEEDFVTYYENDKVKVKIPSKFFELSKGDGFYGYSIMLGLLYPGVSINVYNSKNASILPSLYFEYIDYNYYLDIKLRDDGTPISAKYSKIEKVISSGDLLYSKE